MTRHKKRRAERWYFVASENNYKYEKKLNWFGEGKGDSFEKIHKQFEIIAIILKSCFFWFQTKN